MIAFAVGRRRGGACASMSTRRRRDLASRADAQPTSRRTRRDDGMRTRFVVRSSEAASGRERGVNFRSRWHVTTARSVHPDAPATPVTRDADMCARERPAEADHLLITAFSRLAQSLL
jgi:hypothetical protein